MEDQLAAARDQLVARLSAEIRPERRALLSRGELAKLVDAAVQAYLVRHSLEANPIARRDLVTAIMLVLLNPGSQEQEASSAKRMPHRAAIDAAKAQIQPLVLEHMDVAAAAEMPRAAFEAQLTGWVKELLAETKIQLNFAEQRELVESLIADMLGLGPLEPLIADESVTDIMVNGPQPGLCRAARQARADRCPFRDDAPLAERRDQDRHRRRPPHRRVDGRWSTPACRTAAASTSSSRRWRIDGPSSRSASSPSRRSPST